MSKTNKLHFIEAMLNWFASPSMGRELDVRFLSDAYDDITAPAWVSVEEELPKEKGAYLFHFDDGQTRVEGYFPELHLSKCVTHWMPLPTPPVKKGGEQ